MTPVAPSFKRWILLATVVVVAGCVPIDGAGVAMDQIFTEDESRSTQPGDAGEYYNRGAAKVELGQSEEAIAAFDRAIELRPDDADAYVNRGSANAGLGQYEEAMADYAEAIRLEPDHATAYKNRGIT